MMHLTHTLRAWDTPGFENTLKQELAQLGANHLPLQQGLTTGNYVADAPLTVAVHSVAEIGDVIRVRAGIFYSGVMGGAVVQTTRHPPATSTSTVKCS